MKIGKINIRRVSAAFLAALMAVSVTACGREDGQTQSSDSQGAASGDGMVWVADFKTLDVDSSFYNAKVYDDYLYYEDYQRDEESGANAICISSISLTDGTKGPSIPVAGSPADESGEDSASNESRNVSGFVFDSEGILITIENVYHWDQETNESSQEYYLCKYDPDGGLLSTVNLSDILGDSDWIQYVAMDKDNRIYLSGDSSIYLLDAEGKDCGTIELGGNTWVNTMGAGKDGRVYIAVYDQESNGNVLKALDFEGKRLGDTYSDFIDTNYNILTVGIEKDFMGSDSISLYEYDMESQTKEKVLDWLDCDIDSNNLECLHALEDGRIAVITYDWEKEEGRSELAIIAKVPASEVPEKINITIASIDSDYYVRSAAVNFNKNNDKYHISMKSYFDYNDVTYTDNDSNYTEILADTVNRLNNDITSGNCPDILVLDGVNVSRYASKGVFEDLNSWLDGSSVLSRSDYFENILECYTYDGALLAIPQNFTITSLVGSAADLGTEPGWTLQEIMDYSNAHPDAQLLAYTSKEGALETMLRYTQSNFVDWQSGECSFNSDEFMELLDFVNKFPEEIEYNEDSASPPAKIAKGEILLDTVNLYDFREIQMAEAMFGQPVNYIGCPNENGDSGTYIQPGTGLAILSQSANKEGAWAFLESYLTTYNDDYSWGFSSRKSEFEKEREEATKIEYIYEYEYDKDGNLVINEDGSAAYKLDEDGNPIVALDENGEPMIANGGGGVSYGDDWSYEYHITTEEEADRVEKLISIAKPAGNFDIEILNIVSEEAQAFFKGQKSAKDVAGVIQSRVQVYVNENR